MTMTIGLTAIKAGRNGRIITIFIIREGQSTTRYQSTARRVGIAFITGSQQSYWHTDEKDSLLQVGYSDTLAGIAWSVSYNNNKSAGDAERDQIFALNISVPLSQWLQHDDEVTHHHNVYATFSTSTDKQHNVTQNAALAAHYWTKTILVTTYSKAIRITVLAKAAPPARIRWGERQRQYWL